MAVLEQTYYIFYCTVFCLENEWSKLYIAISSGTDQSFNVFAHTFTSFIADIEKVFHQWGLAASDDHSNVSVSLPSAHKETI